MKKVSFMFVLCMFFIMSGCGYKPPEPTTLTISGNDRSDNYSVRYFEPELTPDAIYGLQFDTKDNLYVLSRLDHEVHVYNSNGLLERIIGGYGVFKGQLKHPKLITIENDELYILDYPDVRTERIQVFTLAGDYIRSLEFPVFAATDMQVLDSQIYLSTASNSNGVICIDANENITHYGSYLAGGLTAIDNEIVFFNSSVPQLKWYHHLGTWTEVFGKIMWFPPSDGGQGIWKLCSDRLEMVYNFPGRNRATDVYFSSHDRIFYVIFNNIEIQRYDENWNYLDTVYVEPNKDNYWNYISVSKNGDIYLGSKHRNEILVITENHI